MHYLAITGDARAEINIKKSRFIAVLIPLQEASAVDSALQGLRLDYPGANHYCYAYIVRQGESLLERCSDDGEPSGTAGWPMLGVLKNKGLQNVLAVVVRYFGGTLLGTGGLVRAYTGALQSCLEAAPLVRMEYAQKIKVTLDYTYYGGFQKQFAELLGRAIDIEFTDRVLIKVWIAVEQLPFFKAWIDNFTGATANIEWCQKDFVPQPLNI